VRPVNSVVFDVGRVLIDFSYDRFFALLNARGGQIRDEADFSARVGLVPYEHGHISNRQFLKQVNALLTRPFPEEELTAAWNDLFSPSPQMLACAARLKMYCRVYLLSNTSELHWQHLKETYRLSHICHDLFASYEVGAMKPAAEIFIAAQQRFGLTPEETLFIDDKQENVSGAIACGWQGLWHEDAEATIARLKTVVGFDG
jgi:glucose-1-phosphatase